MTTRRAGSEAGRERLDRPAAAIRDLVAAGDGSAALEQLDTLLGRRAPVQGDHRVRPSGTVPSVHEQAWLTYGSRHDQSAEDIARHSGFGNGELQCLLAGHYPIGGCDEKHPPMPGWMPR